MDSWFARLEPPPDVFAVVMATCVVSISASDHDYWRIADLLIFFWISFAMWTLVVLGLLHTMAARINHTFASARGMR